jgi:Na+/phosphate symporter
MNKMRKIIRRILLKIAHLIINHYHEYQDKKSERMDFWYKLHDKEFQLSEKAFERNDMKSHERHGNKMKFYHKRYKDELNDKYTC